MHLNGSSEGAPGVAIGGEDPLQLGRLLVQPLGRAQGEEGRTVGLRTLMTVHLPQNILTCSEDI